MTVRIICTIICIMTSAAAYGQVHDPKALRANPVDATGPLAPKLSGLGDHHFAVTTKNDQSQYFFNQGFRLTLGFNHSEALRSFKEAARLDPDNAMAYWGWALVLGPNLNLPMQENVVARAYTAMQKAISLKNQVSPREKAFIEALAVRYSNDPGAARQSLDLAYRDAMKLLVQRYPDDLDAATLYAAAIMNTNPWDYWYPDGTPKPYTVEIMALLKSVIDRDPNHAGAHHYLIHTVEAFRPELGIASADRLGDLMPGAGHLVHMPSHIYMRVGRYADSYEANLRAIKADVGYITQCRAQGLYPLGYYPHNIHFLAWAAMFQGRSEDARNAARDVADAIPAKSRDNTWALYELFRSQPLFVMVRFGQWDDILSTAKPETGAQFITGVWHYGRGLAYAHQGDLARAGKELDKLQKLRLAAQADSNYYAGFGAAGGLLTIAEEILNSELAARKGNMMTAIARLERAVRLEDGLRYNEPPNWIFPVRHLLGALLLEAKLPAEAEVVYWEDLRRNPDNGFALFGLTQSLKAQGKTDMANRIGAQFEKAWVNADRMLTSSRY